MPRGVAPVAHHAAGAATADLPLRPEATVGRILTALENLREEIARAPIDQASLDAIYKRVRLDLGGKGVFVRSSSNCEDLPGFNGAGLYDSVGNVRGKQALGAALKKVWASLWNLRAVEERSVFGVDHRQAAFGLQIQQPAVLEERQRGGARGNFVDLMRG